MYFLRALLALNILLLINSLANAQEIEADTLTTTIADSVEFVTIPSDSANKEDTTLLNADKPQSDIESIINYTARDSIRFDVTSKIIYMYGDGDVDYGNINLKAEEIIVNWTTEVVTATGVYDTSGRLIGKPVFKDAGDEFEADTIMYNITSRKGLIISAVTQEGDGYIQGDKGLKDPDNNIYFRHAMYTTCNLAHPHFYIGANRLKVIPNDKVVCGPFNIWIADVPTPLGFIFGFFPLPEKHKSGILFPSNFGEHNSRGFYFTDAGYYIAIKDYAGIALRGDLYSNGSWRANITSNYRNRYRYNGTVNLNYSRLYDGFVYGEEERQAIPSQYNVLWQHNTDSKGLSRFNANVNVSTSRYYQLNTYNPQSIMRGSMLSNINYYTSFRNTPFTLSTSMMVDQNLVTRANTIKLPEINFSMTRIYPFKKKVGSKNNWYENVSVSYGLNTKFQTTNTPNPLSIVRERGKIADSLLLDTLSFNGDNIQRLLNRIQYGAEHNIDLGTTFKVKKTFLKYFSINPNARYTEYWYPDILRYNYSNNRLDTLPSTSSFHRRYSYNAGVSLNTWLYGTFRFKGSKLSAIRHSMNPSIGYSYKPDFGENQYNNYYNYTDSLGNERNINRFNGFIYGSPSLGKSNLLTFSVNNTLEAKLQTKDTANPFKKIKLLDQFRINGFYNFARDSFQLSDISISAYTRLLGIFDVRYNAVLDPYLWNIDSMTITDRQVSVHQTRVNKLAFLSEGGGIGTLRNSAISLGASFNPTILKSKLSTKEQVAAQGKVPGNIDPQLYVDFNIPWNLNISYIYSVQRTGHGPSYLTQTVQFNGDLKIAENWKIGFTSGYDIKGRGVTITRLEIYRDLHCWQMSLSTVVFSTQQMYMFSISPKSGILQDLKLNKRSPGSFGQSPMFF